ncbi:acetyl esterase [Salisediminibacterium halotolerans]|nr:acetyl esterase [Actinophytocola xinjiangensis]RPE88805.1 acetyl esterase [Salisediminibacterium halotolerans]TWG36834.1 acetyl esterase [Salisediminibacterium halotolerans]
MKRMKTFMRQIIFVGSLVTGIFIIAVAAAIFIWQTTEEGRLPAKTAVVLHAINNDLVPLDTNITPPRIVTGGSSSGPSLLREEIYVPVQGEAQIPMRMYRPQGEGPYPIIMYYHGGAFMEGYGNVDTHDNIIRSIASRTNSIVLAPSYRLAPDYEYPVAVEDSYAALNWAYDHAESFNGDSNRLSVAGDSAGGNIAAIMALMSRDRDGPPIQAQALLYPLTTFLDMTFESRETYDSGYFLLSRSVMYRARDVYTPNESMWSSPYTSPLNADELYDLPPALVITAEFDPLRDEGEAYAKRLADYENSVQTTRYRGVMHGFISFYEVMQSGRAGMQELSSFLNRANSGQLQLKEGYHLQVRQPPQGMNRVREQTEAFAIAAYLLGRSSTDLFSE